MKVLITGGGGFIGSHLAERLLDRGDDVLVIDNFATGRRDNLKEHQKLTLVEGTIADPQLVDGAFSRFCPDLVVHAAASYKNPDDWQEDALTNVLGTINVVKASQRSSVKRIVYFQTSLCYGLKPLEQPITLSHPYFSGSYKGGSSYAVSKTGAEQYIELSGLDFISFRLANAYGPRNLSGPLPTFFYRLTQGKPCFVMDTRRDFIFIDDLADVVIRAVDGAGAGGYYHVSTGRDYAIKELFDATLAALNIKLDREVEVRPRGQDDVYTILLDPSKTEKTFGWKAGTPLQTGIKAAVEWYEEHGITQTFTHLKDPVEKRS